MLDVATINETITGFRKPATDSQQQVAVDLTSKYSLTELSADYVFFHHGAFLLLSGINLDPAQEFMDMVTSGPELFKLTLSTPTFCCTHAIKHGLSNIQGRLEFDSLLWGIDKANWPALHNHLANASVLIRDARRFARAAVQEIWIYDPIYLRDLTVASFQIPKVKVTTYSVDATDCNWRFTQPTSAVNNQSQLINHPVDPKTVDLARALLGESDKPFRAVESIQDDRDAIDRTARDAGVRIPTE